MDGCSIRVDRNCHVEKLGPHGWARNGQRTMSRQPEHMETPPSRKSGVNKGVQGQGKAPLPIVNTRRPSDHPSSRIIRCCPRIQLNTVEVKVCLHPSDSPCMTPSFLFQVLSFRVALFRCQVLYQHVPCFLLVWGNAHVHER
ncbi:hypothetical protein B0O80DRAFT_265123 [Mortierella sp. GBAus27b]|nr:hypothetical protein B0O80DRAFT_265123 [Mortierella sp. GBAus27b]